MVKNEKKFGKDKKSDKGKKSEKGKRSDNEETKYSEKEQLLNFLTDESEGLLYLNTIINESDFMNNNIDLYQATNIQLLTMAESLLDLYSYWLRKCPSRKIFRGTTYDGIKAIEKKCKDPEMKKIFGFITGGKSDYNKNEEN